MEIRSDHETDSVVEAVATTSRRNLTNQGVQTERSVQWWLTHARALKPSDISSVDIPCTDIGQQYSQCYVYLDVRESSKWIKTQGPAFNDFYWQGGYGAFSISPSHIAAVKTYIANQREHHKQVTFQDEFRRLCKKYGLKLDERYAWD